MMPTDVLLLGTGAFAARQLFDLAATTPSPIRVLVAGRNTERLSWLTVAARARAAIYARPLKVEFCKLDLESVAQIEDLLITSKPKVVVQSASAQTSAAIGAQGSAWDTLVSKAGYSVTSALQAVFTMRVAAALKSINSSAALINSSYPDVVNNFVSAADLPISCGVGNVAILSSVFAGHATEGDLDRIKVLAHYQTIAPWRRQASTRTETPARVWIDDNEVDDVYGRFSEVQLTPHPVIDISAATGVPLISAMVGNREWIGHVPGPNGLPGGYPVKLQNGHISLDLPTGITPAAAISWNSRFEEESGAAIEGKRVVFSGRVFEELHKVSPALAKGFELREIETAAKEFAQLRSKLEQQAA